MHLFWRNTGEIPASFLKLVTNMIPTLFHLALDGTNGPGLNLDIPPNALLLADMGYPDDGSGAMQLLKVTVDLHGCPSRKKL